MTKSSILICLGCIISVALTAQLSEANEPASQQILTVTSPYHTADGYISNQWKSLGLSSPDDLVPERTHVWNDVIKKERFTQQYQGIDVIGSSWTLHYKDNEIQRATGKLYDVTSVQMAPQISADLAEDRARFFLENHFKEDVEIPRPLRLQGTVESMRLVLIDQDFPEPTGAMRLAYECITHLNTITHVRERVYVDAADGDIITSLSLVSHTSVEGVANTYYYGEQSIITDSLSADEYTLWDEGRGVYTGDLSVSTGFFGRDFIDFFDADNYWDNRNSHRDEVAGDAHYCSSKMHDFMLSSYNWKGPDGNGMEYRAFVHAAGGAPFVNAYWTGEASYYGDGDCRGYGPLTTLEVVGHEYAHGFTQFSSGLIYRGESGGMNEATSDMFGKALEKQYDPAGFDWLIGESFIENDELQSFRSMEDPNARSNPKYYGGLYWENNGVHSWSGLWNHWFYLLSEGGSGVNEGGYSYSVDSIGIETALDIVFLLHTAYLTPNATYFECRNLSELAVEDLHGPGSDIWVAVEEAWKAIGVVSEGGTSDLKRDLTIQVNFADFGLCRPDSTLVSVNLWNVGTETILMGDSLLIEYDVDDYRKQEWFVLDRDLGINNILPLTFSEEAPITQDEIMVTVTIISSDSNVDNDFAFWFQSYSGSTFADNISLRTSLGTSVEAACDDSAMVNIGFQFFNNGCNDIPRGTILNVNSSSEDGTLSETYEFFLFQGLTSGQSLYFSEFVGDINLGDGEYRINSVLNYADDEPADNDDFANFIPQMVLTPGAVLDFNIGSLFANDQFQYLPGSFSYSDIVLYNGNRVYMTTGGGSSAEIPCKSLADQLKDQNSRSSISFCADATGINNPELHFDLLMKSEEYVPLAGQDPDISCLFEVRLSKSYNVIYDILTSGDDEELVHYSFPLPDNYTDEISLWHFVSRGSFIDVTDPDINLGDVIMLDNVEIREATVSTDVETATTVNVFPNPSGALVNFQSSEAGIYDLSIFTAAGVLAQQATMEHSYQWDVSGHPSGVYIYQLTSRVTGDSSVGKVVVQ